jgi:hypothetical protein
MMSAMIAITKNVGIKKKKKKHANLGMSVVDGSSSLGFFIIIGFPP